MGTRNERVVLELVDLFSGPVLKAAAAVELLDKRIDSLSRDAVQTAKTTRTIDRDVENLGKSSRKTEKEIDKLSGRLRILAEVAAVIGPSAVPIGAVAIPAIAGLASGLGFAALGAGTTVLAFQGLGDALTAMNKASLQPTTENLKKAKEALSVLSPEASRFAKELLSLQPILHDLKRAAGDGMFPAMTAGLQDAIDVAPAVIDLFRAIGIEVGVIAKDVGGSLASGRWDAFLHFLAEEGPSALGDFAQATGNTAHALASLWMATQPLNQDFSEWLVKVTADFDRWSMKLSSTEGFENFVQFIEESGPQVGETLGAIGGALVQVTEAIAPLGGPSLRIIESLADAIATIADSPIGTPLLGIVSAMSALSLATRGYEAIQARTFGSAGAGRMRATSSALLAVTTAQDRARMSATALAAAEGKRSATFKAGAGSIGKNALALGGLALVSTGLADNLGLTNTASLALAGSFAGPWGAAIGGAVGAVGDLSAALGTSEGDIRRYQETLLATAGPSLQAQLAAVTAELEKQKAAANAPGPDFHAFGSHIAPFAFSNDWRDADDKTRALTETQADLEHQIELTGIATDQATSAQARNTLQAKRQKAALHETSAAAKKTAHQFLAFGDDLDDSKVSLDRWIRGIADQAEALEHFTKNARTAGDHGLRDGLIKQLELAGPAGALRMKQLANASDAEISRANRAWARGSRAIKGYNDYKVDAKRIEIDDRAARNKLAGIAGFLDRLLAPKTIQINANYGRGLGVLKSNGGKDGDPNHTYWGGGYTGAGGKYEPAGVVHKREFVFSSEATEGNEAMLDALHQGLRGYATGGLVGGPGGLGGYIRNDLDMKFPRTLKQWENAVERSTKAIDKERSQRDDLISKRADLAATVGGNFQSDLFGDKPTNWAYMSEADRQRYLTHNPTDVANKDTADANTFEALLKQLTSKGLDGQAFAALASTGDIQRAQAYVNDPSQIAVFEHAFNTRNRVTTHLGNYAGGAVYNKQIDDTNDHLSYMQEQNRNLIHEVNELKKEARKNAKDIKNGVNGANSHRAGQLRVAG